MNWEKTVAERFNIKRVSWIGWAQGLSAPDCEGFLKVDAQTIQLEIDEQTIGLEVGEKTIEIVAECKMRKQFPSILIKMIEQARGYIKKRPNVIPIAFLKKPNMLTNDAIVAMRLIDFERLIGKQDDGDV